MNALISDNVLCVVATLEGRFVCCCRLVVGLISRIRKVLAHSVVDIIIQT